MLFSYRCCNAVLVGIGILLVLFCFDLASYHIIDV